ncbi:thrombospondin type-1 domain-containing protein 7A isoform X1 [Spodoptera frugiperda]|uniref:Thrombospondin type-1 domain-containing protein 7A isoform X1 n=1 Tax=Spodoptera frugiperda TaxID=7108 RepID=A0A9R0F5L1_SPOFR|nr:thrombospondin type-1 domain-containing protein 7A isoform X1 [Spodoptera frugiperda]
MCRAWWLMVAAVLASAVADEASDPEGLLEPVAEPSISDSEYSIYIGKWTECNPLGVGEHASRTIERYLRMETDSLVHTPRLGLQRRQVQCRKKDGQFVEAMYCGPVLAEIGTARVCVIKEDCVLAEWLPWRPRPDGALVRTRRLKRLPQGGGKECDVVEEVRPAALEASAHWTPGPWGQCKVAIEAGHTMLQTVSTDDDDDADDNDGTYDDDDDDDDDDDGRAARDVGCGGGVQRRDATCVRADGRALHPAQCAHAPMPTLVQPCEVPCPRDCEVGEWGEWGACQPTDGCPLFPVQQLTTTGYSVRRRRVISAASGGGAPCPPLEEKRTCSTPRCASWKALPWGPCVLNQPHTTCGPGKRSRELRCVGHDGKEAQRAWCSGTGAPPRSERCRIACAGDCVVSSWGAWSHCSAACAAASHPRPSRTRRRHILAHSAPNGWPCPAEDQLFQNETCNTHACATYSWLATPWGPCERRRQDYIPVNNYTDLLDGETFNESDEDEPCIEEGEMMRDVMCVQNNADVVREALCAPLRRPASRRACTVRCRRGCRVEAWMPWSPCPNTCEPGKQVRVRVVHGGPSCGSRMETRECPVSRTCRARDAAWVAGDWSTCRLPPMQRCGVGYRVRSIWCGSESHRVEAGACAGQLIPRSVAACHVTCEHITPLTCDVICSDPLKHLDASDPDVPNCVCKNVSLELLPTDSDCILPSGMECGEGRSLRAARCMVGGRDVPMDVCKKYHPLTGPSRVREASTDGYLYDVEFPSLLRGACSVRCARDCALGEWGEWGPCASEPGSRAAFRFRTREVIEEGSGGGRECGATLQRATCAVSEPRWALGDWSVCSPPRALCGRALINRTVTCVDSDGVELEPTTCEAAGAGPAPTQDAACRAPCPNDCVVSSWSEWSPCEQTKWGGRRDRTRVVLRPADDGGSPCPHLVGAEPCSPHAYTWHVAPWDDCQPLGGSPCGEGTKKRAVRCLRSDGVFVNDSFCPNTTTTEAKESWCYVPCGVDCELSEWGPWDASACSCGDANTASHMRRTRQHLTAAVWPGRACPVTEQRAPCPREPCLKLVARPTLGCHVQVLNETATGLEAVGACGFGVKVSHVRCELTSAADDSADLYLQPWRCAAVLPGRIVAPPMHYQEDEICEVECGCKQSESGQPGPWGSWGPCRGGARSRTRQLLVPARRACSTPSRYVTIEWANCTGELDEIPDLLAVEPREDKPRRLPAPQDIYHDGYIEGSTSVLAVVWTATIVLSFYGAYMLYRGLMRCLRSKKLKTITKV